MRRLLCPRKRGAHWGGRVPRFFSNSLLRIEVSTGGVGLRLMFGRLRARRGVLRLLAAATGLTVATLASAAWRWAHTPRAWKPEEVPVAFWSWRAEAPAQDEVESASKRTGART